MIFVLLSREAHIASKTYRSNEVSISLVFTRKRENGISRRCRVNATAAYSRENANFVTDENTSPAFTTHDGNDGSFGEFG